MLVPAEQDALALEAARGRTAGAVVVVLRFGPGSACLFFMYEAADPPLPVRLCRHYKNPDDFQLTLVVSYFA